MSPENQQVRLDELRVIMGQETTSAAVPTQKVYTVENVAAGGMYMVRIGDGWLNNYYLYYEDGEPVKVEISFQNNYEEEAEKYTFEGDSLEDFWYYGKTLQELISYFADSGYGYETIIYPMD